MADVSHSIKVFTASDGYPIHYRSYEPPKAPRGHLLCLHGIQSHGGWYEQSCTQMAQAGYLVSYLDRRGSGLNWLQRGNAPSYQRLLLDIREFITNTTPTSVPSTLIATSWGGKLGVALAAESNPPMHKLILMCPGLFPQVKPSLPIRLGIGWSRLVKPNRLFPIPLDDPALFTSSRHCQDFLRNDPLSIHRATARFFVESVLLDRRLRQITSLPSIPILLVLAGQDRIIRNDRTETWLKSIAPHTKVVTYPKSHHTLEFEPNHPFVHDILGWID